MASGRRLWPSATTTRGATVPDNEDCHAKDVVICYGGVPVLKMPKDIADILCFREKGANNHEESHDLPADGRENA